MSSSTGGTSSTSGGTSGTITDPEGAQAWVQGFVTSPSGGGQSTWNLIQTAAVGNCVGRSLLTPTPGGTQEQGTFPGYEFDAALDIPPGQVLISTEIYMKFSLNLSQVNDSTTLQKKAGKFANLVAQTEDGVILLGKAWKKYLDPRVEVPHLDEQVGLLRTVPAPLTDPTPEKLLKSLEDA